MWGVNKKNKQKTCKQKRNCLPAILYHIFYGKIESFSVSIYQDATYQLVTNSDNKHQEPADTIKFPLQPSQVNFAKFVVVQHLPLSKMFIRKISFQVTNFWPHTIFLGHQSFGLKHPTSLGLLSKENASDPRWSNAFHPCAPPCFGQIPGRSRLGILSSSMSASMSAVYTVVHIGIYKYCASKNVWSSSKK